MADAPSPEDLAPLMSESAALDTPSVDPYEDEDGEFMAAARVAVGSESAATALKDAIEACLRKHGVIGGDAIDTSAIDELEGAELPEL